MTANKDILDLDELIKKSFKITVVCHSGADSDALGSLLSFREILLTHYKKLFVTVAAEGVSSTLSFHPGFEQVDTKGIIKSLVNSPPDLLVILDFSLWHMISGTSMQQIKSFVEKERIPMVVIDHHPMDLLNIDAKLYINYEDTSTAQTLYRIFFEELRLELTPPVATNLLAGIVSDTNRFMYEYPAIPHALTAASKLVPLSTLSIERMSQYMGSIPDSALSALKLFVKNTKIISESIIYSAVSYAEIGENNLYPFDIASAANFFLPNVLLAIGNKALGFIIYPTKGEEHTFTVRLRSSSDLLNAKSIAEELGGGGHIKAAAARIDAENLDHALEQTLAAIKKLTI